MLASEPGCHDGSRSVRRRRPRRTRLPWEYGAAVELLRPDADAVQARELCALARHARRAALGGVAGQYAQTWAGRALGHGGAVGWCRAAGGCRAVWRAGPAGGCGGIGGNNAEGGRATTVAEAITIRRRHAAIRWARVLVGRTAGVARGSGVDQFATVSDHTDIGLGARVDQRASGSGAALFSPAASRGTGERDIKDESRSGNSNLGRGVSHPDVYRRTSRLGGKIPVRAALYLSPTSARPYQEVCCIGGVLASGRLRRARRVLLLQGALGVGTSRLAQDLLVASGPALRIDLRSVTSPGRALARIVRAAGRSGPGDTPRGCIEGVLRQRPELRVLWLDNVAYQPAIWARWAEHWVSKHAQLIVVVCIQGRGLAGAVEVPPLRVLRRAKERASPAVQLLEEGILRDGGVLPLHSEQSLDRLARRLGGVPQAILRMATLVVRCGLPMVEAASDLGSLTPPQFERGPRFGSGSRGPWRAWSALTDEAQAVLTLLAWLPREVDPSTVVESLEAAIGAPPSLAMFSALYTAGWLGGPHPAILPHLRAFVLGRRPAQPVHLRIAATVWLRLQPGPDPQGQNLPRMLDLVDALAPVDMPCAVALVRRAFDDPEGHEPTTTRVSALLARLHNHPHSKVRLRCILLAATLAERTGEWRSLRAGAIQALKHPPTCRVTRAVAHLGLGAEARDSGRRFAAERHLRAALSQARLSADGTIIAHAHLELSRLATEHAMIERARSHREAAEATLWRRGGACEARAWTARADEHLQRSELDEAGAAVSRGLEVAVGPAEGPLRLLAGLEAVLRGASAQATEQLHRALRIAECHGDSTTRARAQGYLGVVLWAQWNDAAAERALGDAARDLETQDSLRYGSFFAGLGAACAAHRGRVDTARRGWSTARGRIDERDTLAGALDLARVFIDFAEAQVWPGTRRAGQRLMRARRWLDAAQSPRRSGPSTAYGYDGYLVRSVVHRRLNWCDANGISAAEAMKVAEDGSWFIMPPGPAVDCSRRPVLRTMLLHLARARREEPGMPCSADNLIRLMWPDDRADHSSLRSRLKVAASALRALGLGAWLVGDRTGYLINPQLELQFDAEI